MLIKHAHLHSLVVGLSRFISKAKIRIIFLIFSKLGLLDIGASVRRTLFS